MISSTDEVGSSDEVRIEMCSSNFLKAQKLVRANQSFDPESVISETYSSDEDSFLELKRENTRLDKSLKEYKSIISEIVGVMNSTGDVECSTRNVTNRVKEITFEFIQLSNQHSEINHVGNELNEVSHQRQLEQEEIKALRLELEVIREREKRVKSENKIERMKFAHEIERMKFEIERMKLDQEIYTTRQKKLQAKHHKIMKGTKSNCHTACQTSSIIDGAILKQKDEAIASLRKELEGMRIGNNQQPCGSQLEQENKKLRQLKIELEYGVEKYFNLAKRHKVGSKLRVQN